MTDEPEPVPNADELSHPAFRAGLDLLSRTGAGSFQLRCSAEDDPAVWVSIVKFSTSILSTVGHSNNGSVMPDSFYETACGLGPLEAVMRLCDQILEGSTCANCERPILFQLFNTTNVRVLDGPKDSEFCTMAWSPSIERFQPACQRRD